MSEKIIKKICDFTCSFEELQAFCISANPDDIGTSNGFDEFYDIKRILNAVTKLNKNQISASEFAYWCNAYKWIILAGLNTGRKKTAPKAVLKLHIQNRIVDALDTLCYYDDRSKAYIDIDTYVSRFMFFDKILKDFETYKIYDWQIKDACDDDYLLFVLINDNSKYFAELNTLVMDDVDFEHPKNQNALKEKTEVINLLIKNGFSELK